MRFVIPNWIISFFVFLGISLGVYWVSVGWCSGSVVPFSFKVLAFVRSWRGVGMSGKCWMGIFVFLV